MAEFQLKALITGVDKLTPTLSRLQKKIGKMRKETKEAGEGGAVMGAALAAGLTVSLATYADQENAATGLKVAMMDASGAVVPEFAKINKLAIGLGNKLPGTTADFQNMMQMLVRQGIPAEKILGGVGEASAYLAVQLQKSPEAAAEFAAKMQDATGTAADDMMELFDTIQRAFYLGVDDTNMLSFFTKTSSILDLIDKDGLKASQAIAPIAVIMDQTGMAGEAAGNALRKVVQAGLDLNKVNALNKRIGRKGLKLDFTDGKGNFGGLDNMFAQLDKINSLTKKTDKINAIKSIFGDDAETLQVVNTLMKKGKEGYEEVQERMKRQANLNQRVDAQLNTLTNLWESMTGTAVNGLAAIGGAFQGDAKRLVTWLGDIAEKFSDFAEKNPAVIRGAVGVAAGFVAIKLAMLGVNFALGLISKTIGLSPLGIFLRVVAVAAGLIIANWSTIGPWFSKLWQSMSETVSGWITNVKSWWGDFHPLEIIAKQWEPVAQFFKELWDRIRPYIEPIVSGVSKIKSIAGKGMNWLFGDDDTPAGPAGSMNSALRPDFMNSFTPEGAITVNFENAPQGMKIGNTESDGLTINSNVGYTFLKNR